MDPGQGLTFLSAVLHRSSRMPPQPSQCLSSHLVHSPFIVHRLIAALGRSSRFYKFLAASAPEETKFDLKRPDASVMGSAATLTSALGSLHMAVSTTQTPLDVAGTLCRIVQAILGQDVSPAQPLMEVSAYLHPRLIGFQRVLFKICPRMLTVPVKILDSLEMRECGVYVTPQYIGLLPALTGLAQASPCMREAVISFAGMILT